jgi:hypothetical protein
MILGWLDSFLALPDYGLFSVHVQTNESNFGTIVAYKLYQTHLSCLYDIQTITVPD